MSLGKNHLQRTFSKIDNFAWREKKERQENSKNEKKKRKKKERKRERKKEILIHRKNKANIVKSRVGHKLLKMTQIDSK